MSKLDKSKEVIFSHPENIASTIWSFDVLNFDKSKEVNEWHSKNVCCIFVTCEVSNLVTSKEVKLWQQQKALLNDCNFEFSKFGNFIEVIELQFWNKPNIVDTPEISQSDKSIDLN